MWFGWSLAPKGPLLPPIPLPVAAPLRPHLLGCLGRSPADAVCVSMGGILSLARACATAANLHRTAPRTLNPLPVPRLGAANQTSIPTRRSARP
eukprot:2026984-Pyramimonas_sp.AAC.1